MKYPLHTQPNLGTYVTDSCSIEVQEGTGKKRYIESFATEWMDAATFDVMWLAFETKRKESLQVDQSAQIQEAVTVADEEIAKIQNS